MLLYYKIINGKLHLSWDAYTKADHYRIMVMSQTFFYLSIDITKDLYYDVLIDKHDPYIRIKVIAESVNNNVLYESNEINVSYSNIENFQISILNWYKGTTLAFRSKWVYDLYKVYDKSWLIATTEDPILNLPYKISKKWLKEIIIEGYVKDNEKYTLAWISENIAELPKRKKTNYKVSVIIPVYNAQLFLPRTIDSILSSSMHNIEVILVDDWSKDDSPNICNWYAKNFPCVSVVHQINQWVCVARNKGMHIAKGEYVGFVDNDDIVHPLMYEILYNACKKNNTDIAIASTVIRNDINNQEIYLGMPWREWDTIVYTYDELIDNKHKKNNMYFVAVWNKIVKKEVANQVKFPTKYPKNISLYEDSAYTPALYSNIDKFVLCKNAYYIWDKRKQKTVGTASTMHKKESNDDIWKSFIYAYSYPIYNRSKKHEELSDYTNFQRLIESYDKFKTPSPMLDYWNEKLKELIKRQKLMKNKLIMNDEHLREVIEKLMD